MRLPQSLTSDLLSSVLSYSPTRWRRIEKELVRKHPKNWQPTKIAELDFYSRLHGFLQVKQQREDFNQISIKHSSKRKNLDIYSSIISFYKKEEAEQYLTEPESMANYVWAQYESGEADDVEVVEDIKANPKLQELLRESLPETIWERLIPSWPCAVNELRSSIKKLNSNSFDRNLSQAAAEKARAFCRAVEEQLYNLEQREAEKADCIKFWNELVDSLKNVRKYFQDCAVVLEATAAIESVAQDQIDFLTDDRWDMLKKISHAMSEYDTEEENYKNMIAQLESVSQEERSTVHIELGKHIQAQEDHKQTIKQGVVTFAEIAAELLSKADQNSEDHNLLNEEDGGARIDELDTSEKDPTLGANFIKEQKMNFDVSCEGVQNKFTNVPPELIDEESRVQALESKINGLQEENNSLHLVVSHLKKNLKYYWLEEKSEYRQERISENVLEKNTFRSVFEIVRKEDQFNNIKYLDTAIDSAMSCPYKDTSKVYKLLSDLNDFVPEWKDSRKNFGEGLGPTVHLRNRGWGKRNSGHISDTAKGKYGNEYTFDYKGEKVLFGSHVTVGIRNANTCLSLHYMFDEDEEKIVIAHLGRHLTNTRT